MSQSKKNFSVAIDTARVVACFMVVVLHVAAINFYSFDDHGQWWASNFYDSLTRTCVPLFLMITGVLLMRKQESLPQFFKKRFVRIIPPLLFWSLFYMAWNSWQGEHYGRWYEWITAMANGPVTFHLWYLYAIVGIYLFVPFLRKIWHATKQSERKLYLALWASASCWPTLKVLFDIDVDALEVYGIGPFFGLIGYLFLGAYVHDVYVEHPAKRQYWLLSLGLFVLFSVLTMLATYAYSAREGEPDPLFYDYLSPFVLVSSIYAFNVLYGLGARLGKSLDVGVDVPGLKQLSACTLGVYCIHIFILHRFDAATGIMEGDASSWWAIPVTAVVVFSVSMVAIMLLRRFRAFEYVT